MVTTSPSSYLSANARCIVFCELCNEGDVIFMLTDGVHDHLDPRYLGKLPSDFGIGTMCIIVCSFNAYVYGTMCVCVYACALAMVCTTRSF